MAGRKELGLPRTSASSLKEQLARKTLINVRAQGHIYVELREDGKKTIFFCTLCLAPCYSDSILFDHLRGNLHRERYVAAKATLLKSNPWPFNDGVYFFHDSVDEVEQLPASNVDTIRLLDTIVNDEDSLAIVAHVGNTQPSGNEHDSPSRFDSEQVDSDCDRHSCDKDNGDDNGYELVIPGVLHKKEICELHVRLIGVGQIAARFSGKDGAPKEINRLWCEWLGKKNLGNDDTPEHDFAIVTFAYNYDLGRRGLFDDVRYLLLSSSQQDIERARKKRRKSFSDPEDISESLRNQYDSSGEESLSSNGSSCRLPLDGYDDQLLQSGLISSKTARKELRRQQRVAAERMCDICQHKVLPGKDVATLLNMKTGRIVCSSRNVNGAFHVFHVSCLVHWMLLCEFENHTKQMVGAEVKKRPRRKAGAKKKETGMNCEIRSTRMQINSVFCPECQGTGITIHGDELEKPTVALSEMFKYKIKITDARRAWMKSCEELQNCSTGFKFPSQSEEAIQEEVSSLKLLRFYRADE